MPVARPTSSHLSEDDIALAQTAADSRPADPSFAVEINGTRVPTKSQLAQAVADCLRYISQGQPVTVVPADGEIGTQEAAGILNVSRPFLVKLLDARAIPSRKVGVQRRLQIEDVLAYKEREKLARRKVLEELAAEGQRLGLGE